MALLPTHGLITCSNCLPKGSQEHTVDNWRICNDPGAWGSRNPKILVLGFSKGFTQANAILSKPFNNVAFAGMRTRLHDTLVCIGLLVEDCQIDDLFLETESDFAFGSLVRCSLSRLNEKDRKWVATGPVIKKAFQEEPASTYIQACMRNFLSDLPDRLQIVVLLGNDSGYVARVKQALKTLHPVGYRDINGIASLANNRLWVHVAHPSGLNGHFTTWLNGSSTTTAGCKRELAISAIRCVSQY